MKYALILESHGRKYLLGFQNYSWVEKIEPNVEKYTVELKEISSLFIPLEGDAAVYLS